MPTAHLSSDMSPDGVAAVIGRGRSRRGRRRGVRRTAGPRTVPRHCKSDPNAQSRDTQRTLNSIAGPAEMTKRPRTDKPGRGRLAGWTTLPGKGG